MEIKIEKRKLNDKEADLLVEEIKKFPNPLTDKKTWLYLKNVYIVKNNNELIGVCGIRELNNWVKLGPFVVFEKYHKQGFGRKILIAIVNDYSKSNLYIGSRNPAVAKIALSFGFNEVKNIWILPNTIRQYLIKEILQHLNVSYIKEFFRKKPTQEGPYRFFLKTKNRL